MLVDVITEVVIARPPPQVAAFAADPDHAPAWYVNIKSVEWLSEPPLRAARQLQGPGAAEGPAGAARRPWRCGLKDVSGCVALYSRRATRLHA